jgi:hypothetical protein
MQLQDAEILARRLMAEHGLTDWEFGFDTARRRAGRCSHYTKTKSGYIKMERGWICPTNYKGKISLSAPFVILNIEGVVIETILHEIAHALVGKGHHHDKAWREKAISLGDTGKRLLSPEVEMFSLPRWVSLPKSMVSEIKAVKNRARQKSLF